MPALAAVILAHADPAKVRRLIASLDGADVFLHCDRGTPDETVAEMLTGAGQGVTLVPRRRTRLNSWSLVDAELRGLMLALERSRAEHVAVLSGSCYPLAPLTEIEDELARWRGLSRLQITPLPHHRWDTPRNQDGGYWRFRRRFVTVAGQIVSVGGVPLRTFKRPIPDGLRLCASSQWKVYARAHAAALLRVLADSPRQLGFWRRTLVPDESCAASILSSPALVGALAEQVRDDSPWFIRWPPGERSNGHPVWLEGSDFSELRAARTAPLRDPTDVAMPKHEQRAARKLFARKLSSQQIGLLDRIDAELRV
jgi:hypothetical protein